MCQKAAGKLPHPHWERMVCRGSEQGQWGAHVQPKGCGLSRVRELGGLVHTMVTDGWLQGV